MEPYLPTVSKICIIILIISIDRGNIIFLLQVSPVIQSMCNVGSAGQVL